MILDDIAAATVERVAAEKAKTPLPELRKSAESTPTEHPFWFAENLAKPGISFICEVKKASPSKGLIAKDFPYLSIAKAYESAGAAAISVLTEPTFFQGSDRYLQEIAANVSVPVLRKDFVVDEYQIYGAKTIGASAVLLICSLLSPAQLKEYLELAHSLSLSALVEAHDEAEVKMALDAGANIIGVNNRDLRTFTVDMGNSLRLRELVPKEKLFVSESGIHDAADVAKLYHAGVNAVLIGETLMRADDKAGMIAELRSECR